MRRFVQGCCKVRSVKIRGCMGVGWEWWGMFLELWNF